MVINEATHLKTLQRQAHALADTTKQVSILQDDAHLYKLVPFQQKLEESGLYPLACATAQLSVPDMALVQQRNVVVSQH